MSYRAKSGLCTIRFRSVGFSNGWKIPNEMPAEYLPDMAMYVPLAHRMADHVAQLWIPAKDTSDKHLYAYASISVNTATAVSGMFTYCY